VTVCCDVALRSLVEIDRRFRDTAFIVRAILIALLVEAARLKRLSLYARPHGAVAQNLAAVILVAI
jgi:hypothetical protein